MIPLDVFLVIKRHKSVKVLQFYCGELPFDLMYELIKWRFLTSLSGIPVRFHILYELNRHKFESYVLKYGHTKCSRNVIFNYFENYIADRLSGTFTVSFAIHVCVRMQCM